MNADGKLLIEKELTEQVIGCFYAVYNELGSGFLESVYENSLALLIREDGLDVAQQAPLQVDFRGTVVGEFRADLLVERRLIVEIKAVRQQVAAHEEQLLNYLKATGIRVGLLMNFGPKPVFKRRVLESGPLHPRSSASIRVKEKNV
jgi:GxxExxY protein